MRHISIHPHRAGRDEKTMFDLHDFVIFQSTRLVWGGTAPRVKGQRYLFISIPPPHAGRDSLWNLMCVVPFLFQPTRPVRSGTHSFTYNRFTKKFQSTRPMRGGTCRQRYRRCARGNFNPPALCGAGRDIVVKHFADCLISIHPPRAGRDRRRFAPIRIHAYFNPPAPCEAGLKKIKVLREVPLISIHPHRAGRDSKNAQISSCVFDMVAKKTTTKPCVTPCCPEKHRVSAR